MRPEREHSVVGMIVASFLLLAAAAYGASEAEFPWEAWLAEDVADIITPEERAAFEKLESDEAREQFTELFWLKRDPTPDTFRNEFKLEHYRRLKHGQEQFGGPTPGWKSEPGRARPVKPLAWCW